MNAGTLIVSGGISGGGAVTVNGGNLEADSAIVGAVAVNTGGELSGNTGSVGAITSVGGALDPGLTVGSTASGTLTANGNVSLDANSTFNIRVGVTTANNSDNDQLAVAGSNTATLNGTLNITTGSGLGSLVGGNTYNLVYIILNGGYGSGSGTFSSYDINGTLATLSGNTLMAGGDTFEIEYGYGGSGGDTSFTELNGGGANADVALELVSVPEPGAWAMMLAGMGILMVLQRRRRRV